MIDCHRRCWIRASILTAVLLAAAGCSGEGDGLPREPVAGVVNVDGQPLADGTITFSPKGPAGGGASAATSAGAVIKGGSFSIPRDGGLIPGTYTVAIYAAGKKSGEATKPGGSSLSRNKATDVAPETIPAKYNSKTELTHEVKKGGSNDNLKFDLKSKD